jgi:transcriptional regulator with XRE-family HTH domain
MFVKTEERSTARTLRREHGLPVREIARRLNVSPGTVSRWVRDIELTAAQHAALQAVNPRYNAQLGGQNARSASARLARMAAQNQGRDLAQRGDPLHLQGCMLYWAEGSKSRNQAIFTNSDAEMARLFVRFLRQSYAIGDDRIGLTVNCYADNDVEPEAIVAWWLRELDLPAACARAPVVNRVSSASKLRRGHVLRYGTARLVVNSVALVQSIYGAIQEYGGFDRPEWLD